MTPERILQTGLAFWPAKTLLSAIELGVFTELAGGAETLAWLRTRVRRAPGDARPRRRNPRMPAEPPRPAPETGPRLLRHAGRAGLPDPAGRPLREHRGDR